MECTVLQGFTVGLLILELGKLFGSMGLNSYT